MICFFFSYNPHLTINKVKVDNRDCEFWKKKHSTPSPIKIKVNPGVGAYTHFPAEYKTFGKILIEQEQLDKDRIKLGKKTKNPPLQKEGDKYLHTGFGV